MGFITNNGLFWLIFSLALALIILLVIHIIRPNYQQRFVSSTYVWRLSLKYRKRAIHVSKIVNVLIIICQVLIVAACAFIIARPAVSRYEDISEYELVIVMDVSASMRTTDGEKTRIERACDAAYEYGEEVLTEGGYVSVVRCGTESTLLLSRVRGEEGLASLESALDDVRETGCTYASTDLNAALSLCESSVLSVNPDAEIYVFTDERYTQTPEGVNIVNVADEDAEWNAAILGAYTEKIDGYYALFADIAVYGRDAAVSFEITFSDVNAESSGSRSYVARSELYCGEGETVTFVLMNDKTYSSLYESVAGNADGYVVMTDGDFDVYSYGEVTIKLTDANDSYDLDDEYYVYGGQTQVIRVLYTTTTEGYNKYTPAALSAVQSVLSDEYDILVDYEYVTSSTIDNYKSGYEFYLYEHVAPKNLPEDGVVFLFDPDIAPDGAGFRIYDTYTDTDNYDCYLYATDGAEDAPLMHNVSAGSIFLTSATLLADWEGEYTSLMEFECDLGTYPALLYKDDGASKVIVMPFSVNYSNFALRSDFPVFFYNVFSSFFPVAVSETDYTVGDAVTVTVNGEAAEIWRYFSVIWEQASDEKLVGLHASEDGTGYIVTEAEGYEGAEVYSPVSFETLKPGKYLIRCQSYFYDSNSVQKYADYTIFVHADLSESDIFGYGEALSSPYRERKTEELYDDLLLWFAVGLVAVIFIEWILHMREGI